MNNSVTIIVINSTKNEYLIGHEDYLVRKSQIEIDKVPIKNEYRIAAGQEVAAKLTPNSPFMMNTEDQVNFMFASVVNRDFIRLGLGWNEKKLMSVNKKNVYSSTMKYTVIAKTKWMIVVKFED